MFQVDEYAFAIGNDVRDDGGGGFGIVEDYLSCFNILVDNIQRLVS